MKIKRFRIVAIILFSILLLTCKSGQTPSASGSSDPNEVRGIKYSNYAENKLDGGASILVPSDWTVLKRDMPNYGSTSYDFGKDGNCGNACLTHVLTVYIVKDKKFTFERLKNESPIMKLVKLPETIKSVDLSNNIHIEIPPNVKKKRLHMVMLSFGIAQELTYEFKNGQVVILEAFIAASPFLNEDELGTVLLNTYGMFQSFRFNS
ncbi:hypothetical protein EHQ53_17720 [Leptospira langatensis]|uniref:Lipoprotein n=1 Tax=Leptospira langatensis TaxID=2484983 RepID=A0A5F1ZNN3_9LEPT|nr:hypothetical protein [Leptospira langatensis]TGK05468.1 hypothetical protein EHO57_01960 [Leptospira langatensis]TGL38604.1 hypothetical protein EHQ53_17720 [Leptospira langatensis]